MAEPSEWRPSVEREVMWAPWDRPGLEHLRLLTSDGGVVTNGLVIDLEAGRPFRIGYEIRCDERWRVREIRAATPDLEWPVLELLADGEGHWKRRGGEPLPVLDGCIDVDISATPFINTLPIRRLGLEPGESADVDVAYVRVPELLVGPERQRHVTHPKFTRCTFCAATIVGTSTGPTVPTSGYASAPTAGAAPRGFRWNKFAGPYRGGGELE
jgi:hypothetical protein